MKRIPFILCVSFLCAAIACGPASSDNNANNTNNQSNNDKNNVNNPKNNDKNNTNNPKNNDKNNANNPKNNDKNNANNPMGEAKLSFKATFGSNFGNQISPGWRPALALSNNKDAPLVLLLCEPSDTTCENPVYKGEVTPEDPVQSSFGPDVTFEGLPEGEHLAMVFLDSTRSRDRGFGWEETPDKTDETAWGGYVSEFDLMMSDPDESPAVYKNPAPKPVTVMLKGGETAELGTLRLAHFHERRIDPVPEPENGALAVVTESGVRMVNMNTFTVEDAGAGFYDYFLTDSQDNDLGDKGTVCGMVRGEGTTIYVLYKNAASGAGFAVPFDASTRQQVGGGNVITFPGSGTPCDGTYAQVGDRKMLYLMNRGVSGSDRGDEGMWYADVSGIENGDVAGSYISGSDEKLLKVGFNAAVVHDGKLYATMTPLNNEAAHVPADAVENHTVFIAELDAMGRPDFQSGGDYDFWTPIPSKDGVTRANGKVDCIASGSEAGTMAGLTKVKFHDDRNLLLVGGCSRIAVYDMDKGERVDADPANPRSKDIDATLYGHGFTRFDTSPDGKILYALPQYKSQFHLFLAKNQDPDSRQTFNRFMIFPLSLESGDVPALHPEFEGENIDGHEGTTNIGDKSTPANDPGIDINMGHMTRYQVGWVGDLAGSTNQSGSIPIGASIAAGKNTVWLRGSGVPGVSGLGKGANLMAYSVRHRRAHLWAHNRNDTTWTFHHYWQGGNDGSEPFGFDLAPETKSDLATYGMIYVSLD